ncbi:MAG TPA: AAA family ATPase [Steroidobacteraceae bacterium]
MTIHKLIPDSQSEVARPFEAGVALHFEEWSVAQAIVKARALQTFSASAARYPIHRFMSCAARGTLQSLIDDLALEMGLGAQRLDVGHLLLDGPGVFMQVWGSKKSGYCSCSAKIWAEDKPRAEEARAALLRVVGERRIVAPRVTLDWHFCGGTGLNNSSFEEIVEEELHDEAYPVLGEPVRDFINRYLAATETVLVVLGPPGGGKTRLVRAILSELSRRKGDSAEIMYTCDKKALEADEIFVNFITGSHEAFVVEDADHILTPRANGNQDLHRFLAIADGIVRAQGRKIIFTTNLPNVGDLDEALLRPGRCFAAVHTRSLTPAEASRLVSRLCQGDAERERAALEVVLPAGTRSCSVASVYRACIRTDSARSASNPPTQSAERDSTYPA